MGVARWYRRVGFPYLDSIHIYAVCVMFGYYHAIHDDYATILDGCIAQNDFSEIHSNAIFFARHFAIDFLEPAHRTRSPVEWCSSSDCHLNICRLFVGACWLSLVAISGALCTRWRLHAGAHSPFITPIMSPLRQSEMRSNTVIFVMLLSCR